MSKKIVPSSEERAERELPPPSGGQVDPPSGNKIEPKHRNGETTSSSPESGSLNGDAKRSGKSRRRKKRSLNSERRPEERAESAENPPDPRAGLTGLHSECSNVWFKRSIYERAESLYQCWLVNSSNGTTKPNRPVQSSEKDSRSAATLPSSGSAGRRRGPTESHGRNEMSPNQGGLVQVPTEPFVPSSLDLQVQRSRSTTARTPDEGYQSLAATPATPIIQLVTPNSWESLNGLPRLPVELLRDVWLEKPLYDRAEAAFYQNLYGSNLSKRPTATIPTSRSGDHPQSLVEEEEEEEELGKEVVIEQKRVVASNKAEVFHALHPIQEEEEPVEVPENKEAPATPVEYFLHMDSERVWLDKWRFDAAETRFHCSRRDSNVGKKTSKPVSCDALQRDKKMSTSDFLVQEKIWFDKPRYDEAERRFYERVNGSPQATQDVGSNTILQDIVRARENIQKSLAGDTTSAATNTVSCTYEAADQGELISRIENLELQTQSLYQVMESLRAVVSRLECGVTVSGGNSVATTPFPQTSSVPNTNGTGCQQRSGPAISKEEEEEEEEEDEDIDLFGSDEDDEEAEKLKEQRLKEYTEKKAKKPALIAKSSILLDVKPWDDETDMAKLEECVRSVQADGLLWGMSKLVAVGYGIKKLQIACVVEDDKVGTDLLEEEITKFEDFVQSVDVAAFNKI